MLLSPLVSALLGSCSSDTLILLQGFPTSASTEKAWARELSPCILVGNTVCTAPVFPRTLTSSRTKFSVLARSEEDRQSKHQQSQHLRELRVTLRNWTAAFPCVLRDARPHQKHLPDYWHASSPHYNISPFNRINFSPSLSHRELVPPVPLCASQRRRGERAFLHVRPCAVVHLNSNITWNSY